MRQCRALKLRRKEQLFSVRFSVDDDCAAWRNGQSGAESFVFQRLRGHDCDCRQILVECTRYFPNRCRKQDIVSEPNQRLRESFQKRDISADENHFCHYGVSLIQPAVEPTPGRPRAPRSFWFARSGRTRCTHYAAKFSGTGKENRSMPGSPFRLLVELSPSPSGKPRADRRSHSLMRGVAA